MAAQVDRIARAVSALPAADVLAHVPGSTVLDIRPLQGGLTNRSFLVATAQGRYVVRLGTGLDTLLAIDRKMETAAQRLAAAAQIAPRVVHADTGKGLLITEYVDGRSWTPADFTDPKQIDRLAAKLAVLHAIDTGAARDLVPLDPVGLARGYVERICESAPDERGALGRLLAQAGSRQRDCGAGTRPLTLVHSDLHGSNLVDGGPLWLIDWEYATLADPLHDVACLLAYYPEAAPHGARLLAGLGLERAVTPAALDAAVWLFQMLVYLWYRARRVAVEPSLAAIEAEQGSLRALVHNGNL